MIKMTAIDATRNFLAERRQELERELAEIATLEQRLAGGRERSVAARKAQSARMKAYWQKRKAKAAKRR